MKSNKKILLFAVAADLLTAIFVCYAVASYFWFPDGVGVVGARCFRYFTIDSNILCAVFALLSAIYEIRALCGGEIPRFSVVCKAIGTVAVCVTFLTVVLFLGPTQGYGRMYAGAGLWLHLICPLLAMASFILCARNITLCGYTPLWGLLPTAVYGTLYMTMVIFVGTENGKRGWEDFYGFNIGGFWPITFLVMVAFTGGLCYLLSALHNEKTKGEQSCENR